MTRRHEIITHVVEAIAEAEECAPSELGFSLYDHVEAEALLALATSEHADWQLLFHVPNHTVAIRASGEILVDGTVRRELDLPSQQAE